MHERGVITGFYGIFTTYTLLAASSLATCTINVHVHVGSECVLCDS